MPKIYSDKLNKTFTDCIDKTMKLFRVYYVLLHKDSEEYVSGKSHEIKTILILFNDNA